MMNVPAGFVPPAHRTDGHAGFYAHPGQTSAEGVPVQTMYPVYAMHSAFPPGMPMETAQAAAWRMRLSAAMPVQPVPGQPGAETNGAAGSFDLRGLPLHQAARDGDLHKLLTLLDRGSFVDRRPAGLPRPLIVALLADQTAAARVLIERGAAVNSLAVGSDSPLLIAADRGNVAIATLLLDQGAALEVRDARGCTPLMRAVQSGQYAMVDMLINRGADLSAAGPQCATPLHLAVTTYRPDILFLLARGGASLGARDSFGNTPLVIAYQMQNWQAVNFLQSEPERRELALKLLPGILSARAQAPAMSADSQGGFPVPSHLPATQVAMPTPPTQRR